MIVREFKVKSDEQYELKSDVIAFNGDRSKRVKAVWDTGSDITYVSNELANELGLDVYGDASFRTANGISHTTARMLNLRMLGNVNLIDIKAIEADIRPMGHDVLIGMDILTLGEFSLSSHDGDTFFSFKITVDEPTD